MDLGWHITRRWHSYEGELRAAVLRAVLIATFYSVQLVHFFAFAESTEAESVHHQQVTYLCGAWLMLSLAVLVALRQKFFPEYLKYVVTTFDLLLLTLAASLGSGPASPLVGCYFLILGLVALRFSLGLIWYSTILAAACYWALVGFADSTWFDSEHVTPPVVQMVTLCAILSMGVVLGQLVRMIRSAAEEYKNRSSQLAAAEGASQSSEVDTAGGERD